MGVIGENILPCIVGKKQRVLTVHLIQPQNLTQIPPLDYEKNCVYPGCQASTIQEV